MRILGRILVLSRSRHGRDPHMTDPRRNCAIGTPMVLRRVPPDRRRLAEAMTPAMPAPRRTTWWDWVDTVQTSASPDGRSLENLLIVLVAALRGTTASSVSISSSLGLPYP